MESQVLPFRHLEIPTDPKDGGALDWFDLCDRDFCVYLTHFGDKPPGGTASYEDWLIKTLRDTGQQGFYFYPNTHKGMTLKAEVVASIPTPWPQHTNTVLRMPLAHIFGLPNLDPEQELGQMREFLNFVDTRGRGQREDGGDALLQWFRSGYGNSGLDWVGFSDPDVEKSCLSDLDQWLKKDWLANWKANNLAGIKRLRMGPHCWWTMPSLVADRRWKMLLENPSLLPAKPRR